MRKTNYFLLTVCCFLTIASCKKDSQQADNQDLVSVEESAIANENISDTFSDLNGISVENDGMFGVSGSGFQIMDVPDAISEACGQVSISPLTNTWPKTLTIDFGAGCTSDNITRKGKIIAVFSDRLQNPGAKVSVSFENFSINDHHIEGTKTITNNGKNAAGHLNYTVEVSKSKISSTNQAMSFSSVNHIEWIEGAGTRAIADDIFSITGSASGTNSKGIEYALSIVKPLIKKAACRFIVAGSADITSGTRPKLTLDYGAGDCDNKATMTVSGISKEITLRK